ncbi:MAG: TonB-dependent receptor domain-containing protein [Flavisolibacter sp.]
MRYFIPLVILMLTGVTLFGQVTSKVSGIVRDEQNKALSSATVSLLKASDSSLVKIAVTDKSGLYEFISVKDGNYLVSVTSVGYNKSFSSHFAITSGDHKVPDQTLRAASSDLSNVTVTAKKPFIETKLDRTIINVDASPSNAGTTAMDVLEKSPGVMINSDGVISLRGKQGVIVMVDGKPTYLSATDLANMLKNMPSSALEQIEIMTNPSSKYDASGNSGIINIKTKKGKNDGFNGSFMLGATTSIYNAYGNIYLMPKSQNSFNFNYKKGKFNFFGNYNPNFFRGRNTLDFESKQIDAKDGIVKGYTDQETRFKFGNFNQTLKVGVDWYANKKNIFGVVASGFVFNGHPTPTSTANMYDLNHQLETQLQSHTENDISFKNFTGNLNWKHTFDTTGKELTADFDLVRYETHTEMMLTTDIYNGSLAYQGTSYLRGDIPSDINIYSFKSDYTRPITNGRIEAGVKTSLVKYDNLVNYHNKYGSNPWMDDIIRSNHFLYEENINAAYVNVNRQINKWTFQAGLRVENTISKGNQLTTKTTFKRDTTNLFPTAFISYALNKKNTFSVSYGRRINRPNYQDLNPFIFFLDTLSYRQGNIYLRPQYTNNIEISHAFMGKLITTLAYNVTDDVISQIIKPKDNSEGKIRFLTPDNVSQLKNMSASVTIPVPVKKWWNINFFSTVFNNHYTGVYDTIQIDLQYTSFMVNITNTFTFGKGFTAEVSGFYRYKSVEQLTQVDPLYQMNIAFQKQVMKGKGTVRLNVRDPFAWQEFSGYNKYGYVDMHFSARPDIRQVTATFTLRFGKTQQQQQPRKRTLSSQEEQNRVGGAGQG